MEYISKEKKPLIIQVWGKQKATEKKGTKKANKPEQTTKAIVMSEAVKNSSAAGNVRSVSISSFSLCIVKELTVYGYFHILFEIINSFAAKIFFVSLCFAFVFLCF